MDRKQFLTSIRSLLQYHRQLGIDYFPATDDLLHFLKKRVPAAPASPGLAKPALPAERTRPESAVEKKISAQAVTVQPAVNIEDIQQEVAQCKACDLHLQRIYPVAGRGNGNIRLMVVGDWLLADQQGNLPPGLLFGEEQDVMLSRMLKAISLTVEKVFITNTIKCAIPAACQPQATHVESCVSFVRRQIALLQPEVICTMGPVATRAILENGQILSRVRGKFHDYHVPGGPVIPVLPTYHPTFLLQNPEMKQATWADLQLLAKKLGLAVSS